MLRTHTCGELRKQDAGETVTLAGWVETHRVQGKISFLLLRDRYGVTQCFLNPELTQEIGELRRETVVQLVGEVKERPENQIKKELLTGEIELSVTQIKVLGTCEPLPFDEDTASEETRMKYRYLDLRSAERAQKLVFRHKILQASRQFLSQEGFLEIDTPLLVRATPEGARDFLVPSRVNQGNFYALPQSPQLYKQLLMVAGMDKYFQIAKCMRDEDLRADRQPEFSQIDLEMSFPELKDIYALGDRLVQHIVQEALGESLNSPIPRISYAEAIERWGIDKPDIRFGMELATVTEIAHKSEFKVFSTAPCVRAIVVPKSYSRKEIDRYTEHVKIYHAKGLAYLHLKEGKLDGQIAKFLGETILGELQQTLFSKEENKNLNEATVFFVADKPSVANEALAQLRNLLGKELELYDPKELAFCWITEFPLFEWNEDEQRFEPAHHMFTMPTADTMQYLESDKAKVLASCYDLVLNGVEMASGSIRIHDPKIQQRVMEAAGFDPKEAEEKFGFLLEAFKYGAPPHGGFAIGFDRLVATLYGEHDIREFIAFPKNKSMQSPMDGSPSKPDNTQLEELGILVKGKK